MPTLFDKLGPFTKEEELIRGDALKLLGATTAKGEKYNFVYAPVNKEGKEEYQNSFFLPINPANIGRNIVKQGFGKPFEYSLNVDPSGTVQVYP